MCLIRVEAKLCRGPALKELSLTPLVYRAFLWCLHADGNVSFVQVLQCYLYFTVCSQHLYIMSSNIHRGKLDFHKNIPNYFYVAFLFVCFYFCVFCTLVTGGVTDSTDTISVSRLC